MRSSTEVSSVQCWLISIQQVSTLQNASIMNKFNETIMQMCNYSPQFSSSFVLIQECQGSQTDKITEYLI